MIKFKNKGKSTTVRKFLSNLGLSERTLTNLSKVMGYMKINDNAVNMKSIIHRGETIVIDYQETKQSVNVPISNRIPTIVYEDEYILIVDKPSNLPTTPSFSYTDSLAGQTLNYLGKTTFRAMNRLDADTTGCVLIAKDVITENLIKKNGVKKEYLALVEGKTQRRDTINIGIKDDPEQKRRIACVGGLPAITHYKRIKYNLKTDTSLIKCHLEYGRTNQIRCHLSHIGHPLKGDEKYGSLKQDEPFYLRCYMMKFKHPYLHKVIKVKLKTHLK